MKNQNTYFNLRTKFLTTARHSFLDSHLLVKCLNIDGITVFLKVFKH